MENAGTQLVIGNRAPKSIAEKKRALQKAIMPRQSRENTIEEKRRMRNKRNKRKRLSRTAREKENREMRIQKERDAYSRAKELARFYYGKWKALAEQNKKTLDKTKIRERNTTSGPPNSKFATVNLIDPSELQPVSEKELILGQGSYGRCILKSFTRLKVLVVEKQCLLQNTKELLKEAQIMQALTHRNIPTILGIQLERGPISLVMEFKGEENTSITVSKLLYCKESSGILEKVKSSLTNKDWLIICHDITDALAHIHSKGFLHCDLKSNNVLVTDKHGQIIDFGKACDISFPPAKKYTFHYAHIAPEVLNGTHCSKASDVYSLGRILHEIATKQKIPMLLDNAHKCLDINTRRPTTTGLMASLASLICSL